MSDILCLDEPIIMTPNSCMILGCILLSPILVPCGIIGYTGYTIYDIYKWSIINNKLLLLCDHIKSVHNILIIIDKQNISIWKKEKTLYLIIPKSYHVYTDISLLICDYIRDYWTNNLNVVVYIIDHDNIVFSDFDELKSSIKTNSNSTNEKPILNIIHKTSTVDIRSSEYSNIHNNVLETIDGHTCIISKLFDVKIDFDIVN